MQRRNTSGTPPARDRGSLLIAARDATIYRDKLRSGSSKLCPEADALSSEIKLGSVFSSFQNCEQPETELNFSARSVGCLACNREYLTGPRSPIYSKSLAAWVEEDPGFFRISTKATRWIEARGLPLKATPSLQEYFIASLRTRTWLASGSGYRGRHPSKG